MSDLKIQGVVEMSAEGAERVLDRVGDKAVQMAAKTEKAAQKAGDAVDGIGAGANGSADQLTRAEGRMVASIKRVQTQLDLAGKTASQKFEFNIAAKGLDAAKFEPYLAQLRATEAAQARVATGAAEAAGKMAGLAAVAAGGAFAMWVKGAIDAADSLNDLSKSTSIAVETLSGLKMASRQSGAELEGTAQAINKLSVNMGANAAKFAAIGVTAKEPLEAFKQLADVFSKIDDPQLKAALGAEALGKSWAAAAPLLAEGGQSIQDMVDKGARLSGVTQQLADDADAFNDVLEEWKAGIAGVASGIASGLLPVMLAMSENMSAVTGKAEGMSGSFSPVTETLRAVAVLGGNVAFVLRAVGTEFGGMAAQVAAAAHGDFAGAKAIGVMMTADAIAARAAFDKWESGVLSAGEAVARTKKEVVALTDAQKESVKALAASSGGSKSAKAAKEDFTELFQRAEQMKAIYAALGIEFKEIEKQNDDYAKSIAALIDPVEKEADSLERQLETYGQTRSEIEATTIARLEEAKALATLNGAGDDAIAFYEREIAARKRIKEASEGIDARKASEEWAKESKKSAEKAADDWKKTADKIGDSITDALMRGFESGKGFAETLRDTVVNMFKTMVLQPTIKAVVVGGLSAVGFGSTAATAGDLNSLGSFGSLGNIASAGSSAYNLYNGGSGLYGSLANSGVGSALGLSAGLSTSLGVAGGAGTTMGASAALAAAEATSAGATAMTSLGSTVGAAIPYVGAAIAAIGLLTSALGKRGGAKTEGDAYGTLTGSSLSLAAADRTGDNWITGTNSNSVVESLLTPIGTSVSGLIKSMGGSANGLSFNLGYSTDTKGTAKDNIQSGVMDAAGNYVYRNGRNAERGTYSTELNLEVQRMMVAAVKAADVSWVYKDIAGSIDLYSASAEQLQTVLSQLAQVTTLRAAFDTLGFGADKLSKSLIDASGGASALSSNLDSYYQNFYTESERQAKTLAQVGASMSDLGLNMPTTREGFRALVEAQDLTTDSGQKTFAALMSLNSAFASAVPATTAAATAVEAISDAMKSLQADTAKLQVELLAAQGKTAEATAAQRAIDTSGMTSAEAAVYDYNAALRAQIDALNAAKDAETARLSERASLEKDLLSAQGNNVALRELERQALDASNRALFDQVRALEDQQAAAQGAASAANEAFAAAQTATSAALSAVQKSVDAERKAYEASVAAERTRLNASRDVAQEAVSTVKSVLSTLKSSITDLYASVDSASVQSAASGNAFIDSALSAVRKSGYLPDVDALSSAISAARGGLNANGYASQFEYERATLTLAGKLSQLKDAGSSQLSVAEQSLAAANAQLEALDSAAKFAESQFDATISAAQAQVDALNGVDTSVLSVKDAIAALSNAILAQQAAQSKTPAGLASGLYAGNSAAIANPSASDLAYWTNLITQNGYDATKTQFDSDVTRINAQQAQIKSWYAGNPDAIKNPSASDVTYWMKKIDAMGAEAAKAEFTADVKRLVPHLATGTNYVPQDMLAFVHEGEQITPKPYNPALSGARDTQRLERLVEALTTEVQRLQGVVAAGNQHARRTADAVNGNPEQPMLVETV